MPLEPGTFIKYRSYGGSFGYGYVSDWTWLSEDHDITINPVFDSHVPKDDLVDWFNAPRSTCTKATKLEEALFG